MTERWVKMAKKAASEWEGPDTQAFAVKLLARQHAGFVRMVKKELAISKNWAYEGWVPGYRKACEVILAALATHRKGRTC